MTKLSPQRGMRGYISLISQEPPPADLKDGAVVEVVETYGMDVQVMTEDGRKHAVRHWQVDVGYEYKMSGNRRLREYHPEVIQYLENSLADAQAAKESPVKGDQIRGFSRQLERALRPWPPPWNPLPESDR